MNIDPTTRFGNRVENYRRYRPGYPDAVLELMQKSAGLGPGAPIADIGSGTGILTRKLLEAGYTVSAVEPNQPMRQAAEEDLRGFPLFHSIDATAEQTSLPRQHFAAITVAQAFHWFAREAAHQEFQRILCPGGTVFLVWNERTENATPFDREYEALLATLGMTYEGVRNRAGENDLGGFFLPGSYQEARFDNPQIMTWEELRGRFLSSSYVPTEEDSRHAPLLAELERIFRKYESGGQVQFAQQTCVYFGRL